MPDNEKRAAFRALEERVVRGEARSSAEDRARAFANEGLPAPLSELVAKVADRPVDVTEKDLDAAKASGLSEDEVFELVVCAAVGRSARMYDAGLAALADATADRTAEETARAAAERGLGDAS